MAEDNIDKPPISSWPSGLALGKETLLRLREQVAEAQQYSEENFVHNLEKKGCGPFSFCNPLTSTLPLDTFVAAKLCNELTMPARRVTDNAALFTRQSLKHMADVLLGAAETFEQRVVQQQELILSLEAQAVKLMQVT